MPGNLSSIALAEEEALAAEGCTVPESVCKVVQRRNKYPVAELHGQKRTFTDFYGQVDYQKIVRFRP